MTDVVVDVEAGDVEYLITRIEQVTNRSGTNGTTYMVIPWQNILRQHQDDGFTLMVQHSKVQNAPRLTTIPDTTQAGWDKGLDEAWQ